ncbi:hypothetical protein B6U79_03485, partial [Candidatus Bathyarchaeota archaeon ex4484_231]
KERPFNICYGADAVLLGIAFDVSQGFERINPKTQAKPKLQGVSLHPFQLNSVLTKQIMFVLGG